MNLQQRIDLLARLGEYMDSDDEDWQQAREKAGQENGWFIPGFIEAATGHIGRYYLQKERLEEWVKAYQLNTERPRRVGIVMAGNIPLVGFHDFLCVFTSGHQAVIKPSSKDKVLIPHLMEKLNEWAGSEMGIAAERLNGCDAYIATGSNNSARYFEYYFGKYPHIIRNNRTSIAWLSGKESREELESLADDVFLYYGLGCRNVTKIYVPLNYDFVPLLDAFKKYDYLSDNHKYKNNYDYNLALHLLNKKYYMTNGSVLLIEEESYFSPISQLNYSYYADQEKMLEGLGTATDLQCIVGHGFIPFGKAQFPALGDYADGADTLRFLEKL